MVQALAGAVLVARFTAAAPSPAEQEGLGKGAVYRKRYPHLALSSEAEEEDYPPITVLKPLHGDEPLLEEALASVCPQDYPECQIVFGVQDAADTALPVVARLRARFPDCDIAVVVDPTRHGANGKVGNLINMLPRAKHAVLVIADSDLHVQPGLPGRLAEALAEPGTGLVTTLYTGCPRRTALRQRLGATQITHCFLPGALLARAMGRQDCLGATMACAATPGSHRRACGAGRPSGGRPGAGAPGRGARPGGALAPTVPADHRAGGAPARLLRHELRWARTIRALEPAAFAASVLQYPLVWALLAVLLSGGAPGPSACSCIAWVARADRRWPLGVSTVRWRR